MDEVLYSLKREEAWRNLRKGMDGGSYCENASPDYKKASMVIAAYVNLQEALNDYRRSGYPLPREKSDERDA